MSPGSDVMGGDGSQHQAYTVLPSAPNESSAGPSQGKPSLPPAGSMMRKYRGNMSPFEEIKELLQLAVPCIIITGSAQVIVVVSQVYAGHVGTLQLAAVALGNMLWSLMYYLVIGACTALETLGAQASGAHDFHSLVMWDFAGIINTTIMAIPMGLALWNADTVVTTIMGVDANLAAATSVYCKQLVPGLLPAIWALVMSKHLQAQSYAWLPAFAFTIATTSHIFLTQRAAEYGTVAAFGWACSQTRIIQMVAMAAVVAVFEGGRGTKWLAKETWTTGAAILKRAIHFPVLFRFARFAGPGAAGTALEVAAFQTTTAMASYLGALEVATHASAFSLTSLAFMCIPGAISIAAGIRCASFLGAGQGKGAQRSAIVATTFGYSLATMVACILLYNRDIVGFMFTQNDMAMVRLFSAIAPFVAVYQSTSGMLGMSQGVMRGLARQSQLLLHNSIGYGCGLVLSAWLMFGSQQMELEGLWLGSCTGVTIAASLNVFTIVMVNWDAEVAAVKAMQALRQAEQARHTGDILQEEIDFADEPSVKALLQGALIDQGE